MTAITKQSLDQLLESERENLLIIKENRKKIRKLISENRRRRLILNAIRKEVYGIILTRSVSGKTLYQICMEEFGKKDKRFYALYSICTNKFDKEGI